MTEQRFMRGGCWQFEQDLLTNTYRFPCSPIGWGYALGFRVVQDSENRVLRGGSWDDNPNDLRSAIRYRPDPGIWSYCIGFRVVCNE